MECALDVPLQNVSIGKIIASVDPELWNIFQKDPILNLYCDASQFDFQSTQTKQKIVQDYPLFMYRLGLIKLMIAEHFDQLVRWEGLPVAYAPPWSKSSWSMVGLSGITIKLVENGPIYIKDCLAFDDLLSYNMFYVDSVSYKYLHWSIFNQLDSDSWQSYHGSRWFTPGRSIGHWQSLSSH
jgi:hypothetical protein